MFTEATFDFMKPLSDVKVKETEPATLSCEFSKPNELAKWKKGKKDLKPSDKYQMTVDGTVHTLVIQDTQKDDQDKYTVVIADKSSAATVFVLGRFNFLSYIKLNVS